MKIKFVIPGLLVFFACNRQNNLSDAYGNFEATEVVVSAESNGQLRSFTAEEGDLVKSGQLLGIVDTTQLYLKKQQLILSIGAIKSKVQNVDAQINVLLERKRVLYSEKQRLENLFKDEAATQKQLDDINGEMNIVDKEIIATSSQLKTNNSGILSEINPLEIQIDQVTDQLKKCYIRAPKTGTILSRYMEPGEYAVVGKPIFKIADLDKMSLRVYLSGNQLPEVVLGQKVEVIIDGKESDQYLEGTLSWISAHAEFTPKIIQTKEDRVNLVYAAKVITENDGRIKIGMPGEIRLNPTND